MSNGIVCAAISSRSILVFSYKGSLRTVEPHALGYGNKERLTLCGWQLSGGSGEGFRDYLMSEVSAMSTTTNKFSAARPGYNPNDTTMKRIVCRL
jgi:hypothetical protein